MYAIHSFIHSTSTKHISIQYCGEKIKHRPFFVSLIFQLALEQVTFARGPLRINGSPGHDGNPGPGSSGSAQGWGGQGRLPREAACVVSFERQQRFGCPASFFHDSLNLKPQRQVLGGRPSSPWFKSISSIKRPGGLEKLPPLSGYHFPYLQHWKVRRSSDFFQQGMDKEI